MDKNDILNQTNDQPIYEENHENETKSTEYKAIKNYKIIYSIVFKYGIIIIVIAIAITTFLSLIKKEKQLDINKTNNIEKDLLIEKFDQETERIKDIEKDNPELKVKIEQGILDVSENKLLSYDNLISFKGYTIPRWTFLYEPESIENREYFNDPDYDIEILNNFMTNMIFVDYDNIDSKQAENHTFLKLDNKDIEKTFFLSCANRPRLFNAICNKYINTFLEGFFVYKIDDDFQGTVKTLKNLITKKKHKENVCNSLNKYISYSNSTPPELENIAILCGGDYLNNYYLTQDFIKVKNELENKYITSTISKYKEINEYKLISYQQILYNNLEKGFPPYEGAYKNYTNYLISLLRKINEQPIDSFYYDTIYWFNNIYIIPTLNKVKYQSTSNKIEEIENIITDLEKINNGNKLDGYNGLKFALTNNSLEEKINNIGSNFVSKRDDIMSILLKNIKNLSYLKIINDEVIGNDIKIKGYLSINIKGTSSPIFFGATLKNKNGNLIVKEMVLDGYDELNMILEIRIKQKEYGLGEMYEYIQNNIGLYLSQDLNITPCNTIEQRLEKLNINGFELLNCHENGINMTKEYSGEKIYYQVKMNQYNIKSIKTTNNDIQEYINENYTGIKTNSMTISNILSSILAYEPTPANNTGLLQGNNNELIAIDDFKRFLGTVVTDISEKGGKIEVSFEINNIAFFGIYDTNSKKLGPIYLEKKGVDKNETNFSNFELYLTPENQYQINRFLIETVNYLKDIDENIVNKYILNN